MKICSNILVLFLILVIFVSSLYNSFGLARSLSILLIFLEELAFCFIDFLVVSLFTCFQFLTLMLKIMSPRQEELFFSLIFFLVLGIPAHLFFSPFVLKEGSFLLSQAKHPLPSFASVFFSGVIPHSVFELSLSSSSF